MLKKRFSLSLFFMFFFLACHQNPLKDIPDRLREGALHTGEQNLPLFENALYDQLVKLSIQGKSENIITFKEGENSSYTLLIKPLYDLESKYEISIKGNPFVSLKGTRWTFDNKSKKGVLEWTPKKDFTLEKMYSSISIPLFLEFKDRKDNSSFVVEKHIKIIVEKTLDPLEVYRVATHYHEYHRLSDGWFYTHHGAKFLNLQYYDKIFLDRKLTKEFKTFNNLKFYSHEVLSENSAMLRFQYGLEDLFGKNGGQIPYPLLTFLKQPLYYMGSAKQSGKVCELGSVGETYGTFCLLLVQPQQRLGFDKKIYVKRYHIPKAVDVKNLFYKVENKNLCGSYRETIKPGSSHDEDMETPCYFPFSMISSVDQEYFKKNSIYKYLVQNHLEEKGYALYERLKNGTFQPVDTSQWEFKFHKVPDFMKWQISGYRPIEDHSLKVILTAGDYAPNYLKVYVKDYNLFEEAPRLVLFQELHDALFWPFPYLKRWNKHNEQKLARSTWLLQYDTDISFPPVNEEDIPHSFKANFQVETKGVSSDPFSLVFSTLPSLTMSYIEEFHPGTDVKFSRTVETRGHEKKWISSQLSLEHFVKVQLFFPKDFLSRIKIFVFPKVFNLKSYFQPGKTYLDYVDISQTVTSCGVRDLEKPQDLFEGSYCAKCSDFTENLDGDQIYLESICSYNLHISADQTTLGKSIQYFPYKYKVPIGAQVKLDNTFYEETQADDIPMKVIAEDFLPLYPRFEKPQIKEKNIIVGNVIDVFFNLQPQIKPLSHSTEVKRYVISYPAYAEDEQVHSHEHMPTSLPVTFENWSAAGLQPHISCRNKTSKGKRVRTYSSSPEAASICSCKEPVFSKNSLDIVCQFSKDQRDVSVYLQARDPYIFFFNPDPYYEGGYRRTPEVRFSIEDN